MTALRLLVVYRKRSPPPMTSIQLPELHFLLPGESIREKREELLKEGHSLGSLLEINDFIQRTPAVASCENLVIADASEEPPEGCFRLVPASGRCKGTLDGSFTNGRTDYETPVWPGYTQVVCIFVRPS